MRKTKIVMILTVFFILVLSSISYTEEFTADYLETEGDRSVYGKIYFKENNYRIDLTDGKMHVRVLVNPDVNKTVVIDLDNKEYRVIETNSMRSGMNDPFQAYELSRDFGKEEMKGDTTIEGYTCREYMIAMGESPVISKWHSEELGIPLKIVSHSSPEKKVILSNIHKESVSSELFEIPKGIEAWVDPDSKPGQSPDWAEDLSHTPVMEPPFEHEMKEGNTIRIKIIRGKSLAVKALNAVEGSDARVMPFKGQNPLRDESRYNNFAQKGVICSRCHEMSGEADEYVIHVYEGSLTVKAKYMDMYEKTLSAGEECHYDLHGHENIETRFINLTDGVSVAKFEYYQNGKPIDDDMPEKYKTIKLKRPWHKDKKVLGPEGDELVVKVIEGKMQIKLGQYDSFEF